MNIETKIKATLHHYSTKLTFDLQTWLEVLSIPLSKGSLLVNKERYLVSRREYKIQTSVLHISCFDLYLWPRKMLEILYKEVFSRLCISKIEKKWTGQVILERQTYILVTVGCPKSTVLKTHIAFRLKKI